MPLVCASRKTSVSDDTRADIWVAGVFQAMVARIRGPTAEAETACCIQRTRERHLVSLGHGVSESVCVCVCVCVCAGVRVHNSTDLASNPCSNTSWLCNPGRLT